MDGFTIIDGVVALLILLSAVLAYARGIVRETLAIVGWVVAAIVGFTFAPKVQPLVEEIPVVGTILGDSCELSVIAAFAAVFAVALVIAALFTPLFSSVVHRSAIGGLDQGAGFLFGVLRGILLIAVAFFVYDTIMTGQEVAMIDDSRSAQVFGRMTTQIENREPQQVLGWITQQYETLVSVCE
ncbi:CvpA family protein [Sediminimonas sp.]|uniref:CvpA family protein n=1 Tax=Sediminimonas sp. TaxID=2823379 RepID=UPI0025D074EF|nr:CvpA family protein [Sediminimonas sp.]